MSDTLILNRDFKPLSFIPLSLVSWQYAMKLISLDKVEIIKYHNDWKVNTVNQSLSVPSVIVTNNYIKWNKNVKFNRYNVYLRDEYTCQYCLKTFKERDLTLDHVLPKSKGGDTSWENITTSCRDCNNKKADNMLIVPKKKPFVPDYYDITEKKKQGIITVIDEEWITYLQWPKKNVILKEKKNYG